MKNKEINQWLWKWHIIAGLVSMPIVLILAITGGIYLFKDRYEAPRQQRIKKITVQRYALPFEKQKDLVNAELHKPVEAIVVPIASNQATEFVTGKFGHKTSSFIDPYTGDVTGIIKADNGLMYKVRKLHGELLMGGFGTKIVELVASWMVVLILTGLYVWWPAKRWRWQGFFVPRWKMGKRILFRDLHSIGGFWISGLLLLVLAGAFPWTDVVGSNFKKVQQWTKTGFPMAWHGVGIQSQPDGEPLPLDTFVQKAKALDLPGTTTIQFPKGPKGVYSISNTYYKDLSQQEKYHYDAYTGEVLLAQSWSDVGILMRGRMWVMAFHQGQFGPWNWYLMLLIAIGLALTSLSAGISYILRKRRGSWSLPTVPEHVSVGYGIIIAISVLALLFPLFGVSLFLIILFERFKGANLIPVSSRQVTGREL